MGLGNEKTGPPPPGTTIWWRWRVIDQLGRIQLTPKNEIIFHDDRYNWQSIQKENITIYWHDGGSTFGEQVVKRLDTGLSRLELEKPSENPIKAFVYASGEEVRGARLFARAWVGGTAYTTFNIVTIAISPDNLDVEITGLTHELAHLLTHEI